MFAAVGGIVLFALHKTAGNTSLAALSDSGPKKFTGLSPALGVFASIPAIFFAFDGFYTASASFDKMKNPKKGSLAIALGIAVVSFVYIFVSLGI
jgi:amino acid transporter